MSDKMREIKFRGKRIDNGEWAYGYVTFSQDKLTAWISESKEDDWTVKGQVEVIPETIGQYTGLKDKDGKKIFEGDILKVKSFEHPLIVMFDETECGYLAESIKTGMGYSMGNPSIKNEIIGNIHDNPELLEGGE